MKRYLLRVVLAAAATLLVDVAPAAPQAAPESMAGTEARVPQIALVTFGPGPVYWERFGHNALLVRYAGEPAVLYNYGVFNFHQKNFFLNFARGHMQYRLAAQGFDEAVWQYQLEDRWLRVQTLALEPAQARQLAADLQRNLLPENAEYHYDYFISNCSTRVRDAIDRVLGGQLAQQLQAQATAQSYRFEATRLIGPDRLLALGMDLILGPSGDPLLNRWQQSFVPMRLMDAVSQLRVHDASGVERPLVANERLLLSSQHWPELQQPADWRLPFAGIGLAYALLLVILLRARSTTAARYGFAALSSLGNLVSGVIGLILLAAWTLTDHWSMWSNRNLLLFNPLSLLLLPAWLRSARLQWQPQRWQWQLGVLIAAAALLAPLLVLLPDAQRNQQWIALLLPMQLALAWALWSRRR